MSYGDVLEIIAGPNLVADIKTGIATSITPVTYTSFNGRVGGVAFREIEPFVTLRAPTVSTAAVANVYNVTNPIVFIGRDENGDIRAAEVFLTALGGGETCQSLSYLAQVTQIDVPAQLLATGTLQFGLGDLVFDPPATRLAAVTTGPYILATPGSGSVLRTVNYLATELVDLQVARIGRLHATVPFKLYFDTVD